MALQAPPARPALDTVVYRSDGPTLRGMMYRSGGAGPFPALLYNHGGAPGSLFLKTHCDGPDLRPAVSGR